MYNRIENVEMQLQEIEMLQSMYPGSDEFKLDDPSLMLDYQRWLENRTTDAEELLQSLPTFSYRIILNTEGTKVELVVQLPKSYPTCGKPDVYVTSEAFDRKNQSVCNEILTGVITDMDPGELVIGQLVGWVQENSVKYISARQVSNKFDIPSSSPEGGAKAEYNFIRLWIYSHHIYSKTKRKNILDLGKEFQLTGFCMPGKPGIICIEGTERNANEAWAVIRSWNWKKINVKFQESEKSSYLEDFESKRRFPNFEEVGFIKNSESRDYHMDMGDFYNFLCQYQCDYMFKELFGIDKK